MRGPNQGTDKPKSDPKLGFSLFSQVQFITFPLNCIGSLLGTSLTSRGKTHTQKLLGGGVANLGQKGQNWVQNQVFCCLLMFGSLVFL